MFSLLNRAEAQDGAKTRVCLLVGMGDTHTTTSRDVEANQLTVAVGDSDESDIIREYVYIVVWRNGNCNFELRDKLSRVIMEANIAVKGVPFAASSRHHTTAQSPSQRYQRQVSCRAKSRGTPLSWAKGARCRPWRIRRLGRASGREMDLMNRGNC